MKDIIKISWDNGSYELVLDKFFPATIEKTRKVFKLLLADPAWGSEEITELLNYFEKRRTLAIAKAKEARAIAEDTMAYAESIKGQCKRNSPEYGKYMRLRDEARQLNRESKENFKNFDYFVKISFLLRDMWGGQPR